MSEKQKKPVNKKQLIILGGMILLLVVGIYSLIFSEPPVQPVPTQPMETFPSSTIGISNDMNRTAISPEQNLTNATMKENIDRFFVSLVGNKPLGPISTTPAGGLPPLEQNGKALASGGGTTVKLPDLKHPSELNKSPAGSPMVLAGVPTPLPPSFQSLSISGIACNGGVCRASTSIGVLSKGNSFGGGFYIQEKIESISMSGLKTDKRFISY